MVDRITKVTRTGYGSRVGQSIGGVLIGLLLFVASFVVLYWNEGRQDMSLIAATATEIEAETANQDASLDGTLVSLTGTLSTDETLGDDFLVAGDYIAVKRTVEMYAWEESTSSETHTETGGSETTETTYEYDTVWTETPADSDDFEYSGSYYNPTKEIESVTKTVTDAKVGVYAVDADDAELPGFDEVSLSEDNTYILDTAADLYWEDPLYDTYYEYGDQALSSSYIYIGYGTLDNPTVGDYRISYSVLPAGEDVTAFGELDGTKVASYTDEDGNTLYRLFDGSREEAIATLHTEHVTSTWILRVVGFFMMWIGLAAVFGPVSTVLSFIPFLGKLSKSLIGVVAFVVALVLSVLTIVISMILHSVVALIIIGILVLAGVVLIVMGYKKKKGETPPASPPSPEPTQ